MNLTFESNFEKLTCEFSCQPWNSILRYTSWIFWGIHKNLKMNITAIRPHLVFHGFVRVFVLLAAEAKKVENKRKIYIINLEAACSGCEWWWAFMTLNVKLAHPLLGRLGHKAIEKVKWKGNASNLFKLCRFATFRHD